MGANGWTFVFFICRAKCMYFELENQNKDKVMTSLFKILFWRLEIEIK